MGLVKGSKKHVHVSLSPVNALMMSEPKCEEDEVLGEEGEVRGEVLGEEGECVGEEVVNDVDISVIQKAYCTSSE